MLNAENITINGRFFDYSFGKTNSLQKKTDKYSTIPLIISNFV